MMPVVRLPCGCTAGACCVGPGPAVGALGAGGTLGAPVGTDGTAVDSGGTLARLGFSGAPDAVAAARLLGADTALTLDTLPMMLPAGPM